MVFLQKKDNPVQNVLPRRKPIRLPDYDYAASGAYFITVCTANREALFWDIVGTDITAPQSLPLSDIGNIAQQGIAQIPLHYGGVAVDLYCIMPDHIHLILRMNADTRGRIISAPTVSTVIGSMKRWVSRQAGRPLWQKSFYDHAIRNQRDYDEVWAYIENNPTKYLVEKAP